MTWAKIQRCTVHLPPCSCSTPPLDTCLRVNTVVTDTASALDHLQRGLDAQSAGAPPNASGEDRLEAMGAQDLPEQDLLAVHESQTAHLQRGLDAQASPDASGEDRLEACTREEAEAADGRDGGTGVVHPPCTVPQSRFTARVHETVPGVILVKGSGPHRIDYTATPFLNNPESTHSPASSLGTAFSASTATGTSNSGSPGSGSSTSNDPSTIRDPDGAGVSNEGRSDTGATARIMGTPPTHPEQGAGEGVHVRGPASSGAQETRSSGGAMKQVVVSRKCGEAVLRGADVRTLCVLCVVYTFILFDPTL